ncbi:hypothetical protein P4S68_21230 [Pseudoalteromonas sp. Hal099]
MITLRLLAFESAGTTPAQSLPEPSDVSPGAQQCPAPTSSKGRADSAA